MISSFRLRFGRSPGGEALSIPTAPVTVFVGPNNSGKSRVLQEIQRACSNGKIDPSFLILAKLTFSRFTDHEVALFLESIKRFPRPEELTDPNFVLPAIEPGNSTTLMPLLQNPNINPYLFCPYFLVHSVSMLDGQSRINLINAQSAGDLRTEPESSLQVLFRDDSKRLEVRRIIHDAFGLFFVIDPTNLGTFSIRLSERMPNNRVEERGFEEETVRFYSAAEQIEQTSDGIKAFTGIVTQVIAGDPRILLIDEPEAFLHPSLASKLGYEMARAALTSNKRIFASTHSPAFVMGCIQSGAPVNIVRLTYRASTATARLLPSNEISELMRHPLLRSTNVLSGLFYEFVIITESDADRAFYQEVNERLLRFKPEWGIPNCLFLNAQNKQTVHSIMRPLRQLGIPAAGIVDVDALKEGGANWTNLLEGASVPPIGHGSLATLRSAVKQAMDNTGKDMKREGGVDILQPSDREAALNLLEQLAKYGIFIVPGGELESWVKHLGVSGHGPTWLINVFDKIGGDPGVPGYLKPANDDVWQFMGKIRSWLVDVERKGIPL